MAEKAFCVPFAINGLDKRCDQEICKKYTYSTCRSRSNGFDIWPRIPQSTLDKRSNIVFFEDFRASFYSRRKRIISTCNTYMECIFAASHLTAVKLRSLEYMDCHWEDSENTETIARSSYSADGEPFMQFTSCDTPRCLKQSVEPKLSAIVIYLFW